MISKDEGTVGELLRWVMPSMRTNQRPPRWPPDMFALCGAILQKSGGYAAVVNKWPPSSRPALTLKKWEKKMERLGRAWRKEFATKVPSEIRSWWKVVLAHQNLRLFEVLNQDNLCHALLQLVAAADEASAGVGIPSKKKRRDDFERVAGSLLIAPTSDQKGATLCRSIHSSKVRVLPKQHIPRSGITMRSLTHHLAFCAGSDIVPHWYMGLNDIESHSLNILLVPWPLEVTPAQFCAARSSLGEMVRKFGFFSYSPHLRDEATAAKDIKTIVERAEKGVGRIDGVILPELALTPEEHIKLRDALIGEGRFLICGVCEAGGDDGGPGRNCLVFDIPLARPADTEATYIEFKQDKHHRWRLDRSQIVQYGIGRQLDPTREWWEYIVLSQRELNFVTLKDWLTMCVLVCEDLARPDPVGDLVRAVGPNLVVALLMDGPQLASRWPGRYATVLAEDPGSSVLSLSSIGMVSLSKPPAGVPPSRAIALWKDAKNRDPIQIDLPHGSDGIVLTLTRDLEQEFTPDGRSDGGFTAYPVLSGVYAVKKDGDPPSPSTNKKK